MLDAYASGNEAFKDMTGRYGLNAQLIDDVMEGVQEVRPSAGVDFKVTLRLGLIRFKKNPFQSPVGMRLSSGLCLPVGWIHEAGELELAGILMLRIVNKLQNVEGCLQFRDCKQASKC